MPTLGSALIRGLSAPYPVGARLRDEAIVSVSIERSLTS